MGFGVVWWSVATILTPIAARIGLPFLLIMRAFMGVGEVGSAMLVGFNFYPVLACGYLAPKLITCLVKQHSLLFFFFSSTN